MYPKIMNSPMRYCFFILLGAFLLMFDAIYNGFPIVYADTNTYISSGFALETPVDRPITYGLLIRLWSFNGLSLWLVVFFQAFIMSFLLFELTFLLSKNRENYLKPLISIAFLSFFSGLSWTSSQIMADIFTPMGFIALILILFGNNTKSNSIILYILFFISVAAHIAHLLLFSVLLFTLFVFRKWLIPIALYPKRNVLLLKLFILVLLSISTMGAPLSKSKHIFFMGAMVEHGILKTYLDDNCAQKNYKICAYKNELPPKAYQFIWEKTSPLYKIGDWKSTKTEFNDIIFETLTQPKYIKMHISTSLLATYEQLKMFKIGDGNGVFSAGTAVYDCVNRLFNYELTQYANSKQNTHRLGFVDTWNKVFYVIMILSLIPLCLFLFNNTIETKSIVIFILIAILLNAWDSATFGNAIDRLGCKMMWLIPYLGFLWTYNALYSKNKSKI